MKLQRSSVLDYCIAKQAGFMPTYWLHISLSNDRTPEIPGSVEDRVAKQYTRLPKGPQDRKTWGFLFAVKE